MLSVQLNMSKPINQLLNHTRHFTNPHIHLFSRQQDLQGHMSRESILPGFELCACRWTSYFGPIPISILYGATSCYGCGLEVMTVRMKITMPASKEESCYNIIYIRTAALFQTVLWTTSQMFPCNKSSGVLSYTRKHWFPDFLYMITCSFRCTKGETMTKLCQTACVAEVVSCIWPQS